MCIRDSSDKDTIGAATDVCPRKTEYPVEPMLTANNNTENVRRSTGREYHFVFGSTVEFGAL